MIQAYSAVCVTNLFHVFVVEGEIEELRVGDDTLLGHALRDDNIALFISPILSSSSRVFGSHILTSLLIAVAGEEQRNAPQAVRTC